MSWQRFDNGRLTEQGDDTTRTVTTYDPQGNVTSTRPYSDDENAAADAALALAARVDDHDARLARIEAHLWPADPDPEPGEPVDAPTWDELDPPNWWPANGLLREGETVWRNVSGTVLTTPPSLMPGMPGNAATWSHLFTVALAPDPEPPVTYPAWSAQATYEVGDRVTDQGRIWECKVAHGPEYQGTWRPSPGIPQVWADLGPA